MLKIECPECGEAFRPRSRVQGYCSKRCGKRARDRARSSTNVKYQHKEDQESLAMARACLEAYRRNEYY